MNVLFDIALCHCFFTKTKDTIIYKPKDQFNYSNCVCPEEKKLVNFQLYLNQAFERDPFYYQKKKRKDFNKKYQVKILTVHQILIATT